MKKMNTSLKLIPPISFKFIVGEDIAMLRVDVATARICNINDEVLKWNVMSGNK